MSKNHIDLIDPLDISFDMGEQAFIIDPCFKRMIPFELSGYSVKHIYNEQFLLKHKGNKVTYNNNEMLFLTLFSEDVLLEFGFCFELGKPRLLLRLLVRRKDGSVESLNQSIDSYRMKKIEERCPDLFRKLRQFNTKLQSASN